MNEKAAHLRTSRWLRQCGHTNREHKVTWKMGGSMKPEDKLGISESLKANTCKYPRCRNENIKIRRRYVYRPGWMITIWGYSTWLHNMGSTSSKGLLYKCLFKLQTTNQPTQVLKKERKSTESIDVWIEWLFTLILLVEYPLTTVTKFLVKQ